LKVTDVSEEHAASIFRVEKYAIQKTVKWQKELISYKCHSTGHVVTGFQDLLVSQIVILLPRVIPYLAST
jgi:hypothetical protein